MTSFAPLTFRGPTQYRALAALELVQQLFDDKDMVCVADPRYGCCLTVATSLHRRFVTKEVNEQIVNVQSKSSSLFVAVFCFHD